MNRVKNANKDKNKLVKLSKKIKYRGKKDNFLKNIISKEITACDQSISQAYYHMEVDKIVLGILNEYDYIGDQDGENTD